MKSAEPPQIGGDRRPSWSLAFRLTLFNTLSAFFILALIALLLYLSLAFQLNSQNSLFLQDQVVSIERLMYSPSGKTSIDGEINPDGETKDYITRYIRLLDRKEHLLKETKGMDEAAPHSRFKVPLRDGRPGVARLWREEDGRVMLGTSVWVDVGLGTGEQGILEMALDVSSMDSILVGYRHKIYAALLLGLLLCGGISYASAQRATRPLREMTEQVRAISASNLKERFAGKEWPLELENLGTALNLMLDRLEDSFERLYNSARNLSHKIKTPLTILKGEAEVALSKSRTIEELQHVVVSSLEENARLIRLVDNILFLTNAEMGRLQTVPVELDVRSEIDNVIDYYSPIVEEKGIVIDCEGEGTVVADATQFRKVVAALLSNALVYNQEGGRVSFAVRPDGAHGGEIRVTDTGCGIDLSEQVKIMDRFYRVYATRFMDPHGTGLGLPIVSAIMKLHDGTVGIDSRLGHGTTVTLNFPAPPAT